MSTTQIPAEIKAIAGRGVHAAAQAEDGAWLVATSSALRIFELAVAAPQYRQVAEFEWWQFANGSFQGEKRLLQLTFIDPQLAALTFSLPQRKDRAAMKLVAAVTERIDNSIVYQQFGDLPSGVTVRGQVRRGSDGELFAQLPWQQAVTAEDRRILAQLERELMEAVGR